MKWHLSCSHLSLPAEAVLAEMSTLLLFANDDNMMGVTWGIQEPI